MQQRPYLCACICFLTWVILGAFIILLNRMWDDAIKFQGVRGLFNQCNISDDAAKPCFNGSASCETNNRVKARLCGHAGPHVWRFQKNEHYCTGDEPATDNWR